MDSLDPSVLRAIHELPCERRSRTRIASHDGKRIFLVNGRYRSGCRVYSQETLSRVLLSILRSSIVFFILFYLFFGYSQIYSNNIINRPIDKNPGLRVFNSLGNRCSEKRGTFFSFFCHLFPLRQGKLIINCCI